MLRIFVLALALALPAAASASTLYKASAHHPDKHAVWVPGVATDLHFDPHGTFTKNDDHWTLEGALYSKSDPSKTYALSVTFSDVKTAQQYLDAGHTALKGAGWHERQDDWMFAKTVAGTLTATHGTFDSYNITRIGGKHDYWAQLGTGLNDKNDEYGLSSWLGFYNDQHWHRGDFNWNLERPVPEPSAALIFATGLVIASRARRKSLA
ncbi:MAG: PEP-CTERM sorting domain-containing protein [Myxococcota bacterium]